VAILFSPRLFAANDSPLTGLEEKQAIAITIDAEQLIELFQSVPGLKIIDSRHHEDYIQGYIETSRNLPLAETDCKALSKLAKSTEEAMVFYCNNNSGDASIEAIQIASGCGYKRLFWFSGGFVEWKDKDYPYVIE
jgi:rhodanese-related sulfurtransferase